MTTPPSAPPAPGLQRPSLSAIASPVPRDGRFRGAIGLVLCLGLSTWSPLAAAEDLLDAAAAGAGGAVVAHPTSNMATTYNPAALPLVARYDVGGAFRYGPSRDLRWAVSIADASTNPYISFGFIYEGGQTNPPLLTGELPGWWPEGEEIPNRRQTHDLTFALAAPFFERRLSIGMNGTLAVFNADRLGVGTTGNMDLGIATRPVEQFSAGLTVRDILPVPDQFSRPTTVAMGVRAGQPDLITAALDVSVRTEHVQRSPVDVGFGVEGRVKFLDLRAGYRLDGDRFDEDGGQHGLTLGLGAGNEAGHIAYAVEVPLKGTTAAMTRHTISLVVRTKGLDAAEDSVEFGDPLDGVRGMDRNMGR